jgi:phage minor structural protein
VQALQLYILDKNEQLKMVLDNQGTSETSPLFYSPIFKEKTNSYSTFEFDLVNYDNLPIDITTDDYVLFEDVLSSEADVYHMFKIIRVEEEHNDIKSMHVYAEHVIIELLDITLDRDIHYNGATLSSYMFTFANLTRWTFSGHNFPSKRVEKVEKLKYQSLFNSINRVVQIFGGELRYRIRYKGGQFVERSFYVNDPSKSTFEGKYFEFGENMNSIKRTIDASEVKTAVIGLGKEDENTKEALTFANVNNGQIFYEDATAKNRFGIYMNGKMENRMYVYRDSEIEDALELFNASKNVLADLTTPRITYEADVIEIAEILGITAGRVRIGDIVRVLDTTFKPTLELDARVIEVEHDLLDLSKTKITLGNFVPSLVTNDVVTQADLDNAVSSNTIRTMAGTNYIQDSSFGNGFNGWNVNTTDIVLEGAKVSDAVAEDYQSFSTAYGLHLDATLDSTLKTVNVPCDTNGTTVGIQLVDKVNNEVVFSKDVTLNAGNNTVEIGYTMKKGGSYFLATTGSPKGGKLIRYVGSKGVTTFPYVGKGVTITGSGSQGVAGNGWYYFFDLTINSATIVDVREELDLFKDAVQLQSVVGTTYIEQSLFKNPNALKGSTITFSSYQKYKDVVRGEGDTYGLLVRVYYKYKTKNGETKFKYPPMIHGDGTQDEWKRESYTINLFDDDMEKIEDIRVQIKFADNTTGIAWVTGLQFELGTVLTDWKPYPSELPVKWLEGAINVANNEIMSTGGFVYMTDDGGIEVYDKPRDENPTKAVRIKGGIIGISNTKNPDGSFLFRTALDGDGIVADEIKTGKMSFDRLEGGSLRLGGNEDTGYGRFEVYSENGEEVATLDGKGGGFNHLGIDELQRTRNVVFSSAQGITPNLEGGRIKYYVDPQYGNDNGKGTIDDPVASLQEAINRLPKYLQHTVEIYCRPALLNDSEITIEGFMGTKDILLYVWTTQVRFIREEMNGNSSNSGSHWVEFDVFSGVNEGTNYRSRVNTYGYVETNSGSANDGDVLHDTKRLADGDKNSSNYFDAGNSSNTTDGKPPYVLLYLGGIMDVKTIKRWHYFSDSNGRSYKDVVLQYGESKDRMYTIFDSNRDGEYTETADGASAFIYPRILGSTTIRNNSNQVKFFGYIFQAMADAKSSDYPLKVENAECELTDSACIGSRNTSFALWVTRRAHVISNNSEFSITKDAGVGAGYGGFFDANGTTRGSRNSNVGMKAIASGSIGGVGTSPQGDNSATAVDGGAYSGKTFTAREGTFVKPSTPPPPKTQTITKTVTYNTTSTKSWRPNFGGQWYDGSDVLQGMWSGYGLYKGCWFFGDTPVNAVKGKTIKRVRLYVSRQSAGGYSSDVSAIFRPHGYASRPSGEPTYQSGSVSQAFGWGDDGWIDVTSIMASGLKAGTTKGVMIYTGSTANTNYMRFNGTGKLEITYSYETTV